MVVARRPWAVAATVATIATAITYVILIARQSAPGTIDDPGRVTVVLAALVALASLTALGALSSIGRVRRNSLVAAALGLFALGILAVWSIGALLLLAGLFAVLALVRDRNG